jgi:hypothetical protein
MGLFSSIEFALSLSNIFLALVIFVCALFVLDYRKRYGHNYPPGPPSLPFIGNVHQIPRHQPWKQFKKWSEEYGPIFTLWLGHSNPTIVIGSVDVAYDLLERKSTIYSSRPRFPVMGNVPYVQIRF